ncbi:hypothetical protein SCLCIDRAFT_1209758 [Scleroderma citrinum Foug A]|uniref:Heterokaryon incompatibility domain-containing protein n=1 Tax=Scleroderma citrinum Foug A TaxID=1036808 RepID=A0A0C3EHC9_9AGAM|nr:hypothetical protein SCLCIDRAFT_1209758 [Scleroderma citrinum Foug A]
MGQRATLDLHPPGDPERSTYLLELSDRHYNRFRQGHLLMDLEEAIAIGREVLELCPSGRPNRPSALHNLARCLLDRFDREHRSSDLEEAIALCRGALELCPHGHPDRSASLHVFACCLSEQFRKAGGKGDLKEMILLVREALELRPPGHPDRSWSLHCLAIYLSDRFDKDGHLEDIEEAITLGRDALDLRPLGHPERHFSLNNLAGYLHRRYCAQHKTADLEEAITLVQAALDLRPPGHPVRSASLHELAAYLCTRFDKDGQMVDLETAITTGRDAVDLRPSGHPERHFSLNNLAGYFHRRYYMESNATDLEEAITLVQAALDLRPLGHPKRSTSLHSLALCLSNRFDESGQMVDLEKAITIARDVVDLLAPGHPYRDYSLSSLASYLHKRYLKTHGIVDLLEAITVEQAALDLRPLGHPKRSISLQSLDLYLSNYYSDKDGQMESVEGVDIDKAITIQRETVALYSLGHPRFIPSLGTLANSFAKRFQQQGNIGDLDEFTALYRNLLEVSLADRHARSVSLHGLALGCWYKFQNQGGTSILDEAIALERAAFQLRQQGGAGRAESLHSLVLFLNARLAETGKLDDLEELIELGCGIAQDTNPIQPDNASSLRKPGLFLPGRFDRLGASVDIEEAIALTQSALQRCPKQHPSRSTLQIALRCYQEKKNMKPSAQSHPDAVKNLVKVTLVDTLDTLPSRLLNTQTGLLCDKDLLTADFENSPQFQQLTLSAARLDSSQYEEHIRKTVSAYFKYATLSHRWGKDEPQLRDVRGRVIYQLDPTDGIMKLRSFCITARKHGYSWAWTDTCCIDKYSTVELAKAIASMFLWYRRSALTIVYLADVYGPGWLFSSIWFERGWTLQELLAPRAVLFYTHDWSLYRECSSSNHKEDCVVLCELEHATGITPQDLTNFNPGMDNARSRLQWASRRRTTEPEDIAYSLFGIFNVYLPIIPGESAENALGRLLGEIISQSEDISVLSWVGEASPFHSCFPAHITSYQSEPYAPPSLPANELQVSTSDFSPDEAKAFVRSLSALGRPRFVGRQLSLPCIMYQVHDVRLARADPGSTFHVHEILAENLAPIQLVLPHVLPPITYSSQTHTRTLSQNVRAQIYPYVPSLHGSPYVLPHGGSPYVIPHDGSPYVIPHDGSPYVIPHDGSPYVIPHGGSPYVIPHGGSPYVSPYNVPSPYTHIPHNTYTFSPHARTSRYALIRPWDSKLLGSSPNADNTTVTKQLFTMFSQPFSVLLLEKASPEDEYYRRIASSSPIFASAASAASIIQSKVQTVTIV